jgi:hypothetical protein
MSDGARRAAPRPRPSWKPHTRLPSTVDTVRDASSTCRRLQLPESSTSRYVSLCQGTAAAMETKLAALPTPSVKPRKPEPAMGLRVPVVRSTRFIVAEPK